MGEEIGVRSLDARRPLEDQRVDAKHIRRVLLSRQRKKF
jgi:hypothetical protein